MDTKFYAYFLPQFYPTPENDAHWGKGFTEWTNINKAKKLFKEHKQPLKPKDLGQYDLSEKRDLEKVIKYSQKINLDGLIYWHYWFGNDFITLEKVPKNHLKNKTITQNFCFAWANGDWKKSWKGDDKTVIFKQTYSEQSALDHFEYLKPFFKDNRYLKFEGKFLFQVNNVINKEVLRHMQILNKQSVQHFGVPIHFLIPKCPLRVKINDLDYSLTSYPPGEIYSPLVSYKVQRVLKILKLLKRPIVISEKGYLKSFKKFLSKNPELIPCILPGWDNTPRYGKNGVVVNAHIPTLIEKQVTTLLKSKIDSPIILVKAFNEWAEGNILEPYQLNGKSFYPKEGLRMKKQIH